LIPRRLIANLDGEAELARLARPGATLEPLGRGALEAAARMGTLLRALAGPGDRLHLAAALDPERLAPLPGLPLPELETGPLGGLPPAAATLAWCETPAVAALRRRGETPRPAAGARSWWEALWQGPPPAPPVVARVHDRRFLLATTRDLAVALPGARLVGGIAELEAHLAAGGAAASPEGDWVLKGRFSGAGRRRFVGRGVPAPGTPGRRRLDALFERCGELLFEPWLPRTDDFGLGAVLGDRSLAVVTVHHQRVSAAGGFQGVRLPPRFPGLEGFPGLQAAERAAVAEALAGVAERLRAAGFHGPFGIDFFRYRDQQGRLRLHPLGEINARLTVGIVARALLDRVTEPLGLARHAALEVGLAPAPPHPQARSLLTPGPGSPDALWLVPVDP
jgi:hypothetical protein